jgi:pimeloyl-ACP methyl ester carboxylesterase/DNA-binding CsgD family transcriptional regulator
LQQSIRYLKAADGVRLAWASAGNGPALVKAANWLTHLNYDLESPVWRHWIEFFANHFRFIRYDERGCGMTDWNVGDLTPERWPEDLAAVVDASQPEGKFTLLGISQGTAAAVMYAVRHPERVSQLVIYGGYSQGWVHRDDPEGLRRYRAMTELARLGWGKEHPVFRQLFTSLFVPDAGPEQIEWFNELCRRTTTPEIATRLLTARAEANVRELLPQVRVPTLILHARHDEVVPFYSGQTLAAEIPNAEFVQLEPAWEVFKSAFLRFTHSQAPAASVNPLFSTLTEREQEILRALVAGRTNTEIGAALFISEKTVRNALTRIFEKLGVKTRTQAAVLAQDFARR